MSQESKNKIQNAANRLGCKFNSDFTNLVNILLANSTGSPKYLAAKNLGIPILLPEWLYSMEKFGWSEQEAVDHFKEFRVRPLMGKLVSTTGISGLELGSIVDMISLLGGVYKPDMSNSTHILLCKDIDGNSPKLEAARNWNIEIYAYSWLNQLKNDFEQEMDINWNDVVKGDCASQKEGDYFDGASIYLGSGFDDSLRDYLRKLVRNGRGTFMNSFDACVTHYITSGERPSLQDKQMLKELSANVCVVSSKWLSDCSIKRKMVPSEEYSTKEVEEIQAEIMQPKEKPKEIIVMKKKTKRLFEEMKFRIEGFSDEETRALHEYIISFGGTIHSHTGIQIRPFSTVHVTNTKVLTEFWVEKCIQMSQLVSVDDSPLYKPSQYELPNKFFSNFTIGITGYAEVDRIWASRIISCLGGVPTETFSRKNTHLLCQNKSNESAKIKKAIEWNIPLVDTEWLHEWVEHGRDSLEKKDVAWEQSSTAQKGESSQINSNPKLESCTATNNVDLLDDLLFNDENQNAGMNCLNDSLGWSKRTLDTKKRPIAFEIQNVDQKPMLGAIEISYDDVDSQNYTKNLLGDLFTPKKPKLTDRPKVFLISGVTTSKRELESQISSLGGKLLHESRWDSSCTHLIVGSAQKTEKILSACCMGTWIINFKYIQDSYMEGSFKNELEYIDKHSKSLSEYSHVALYWRNRYQNTHQKAFHGWKVYLQSKTDGFQRMLQLGNAKIIDSIHDLKGEGFCLIDKSKFSEANKVDGITYIESTYLVEYILSCGSKTKEEFKLK